MWKPVGISMLVLFSTTAYFYLLMTTNKTMLPKPNHPGYSHGMEIIELSSTKPSANPGSPSSVVSSSSVLSLYSGSFFIDHDEKHELTIDLPAGFFPSTVITMDDSVSTYPVEAAIKHFHSVDDVFHTHFLEMVILVQSEPGNIDPSSAIYQYLVTLGVKRLAFLDRGLASRKAILNGPYFSSREGLHLVWKLWPDTQCAFLASLVQTRSQQIKYMNSSIPEASPNLAIALPSRLYFRPSAGKPLNGLRVAIKDNIDIAGVRTTGTSRAYGELYGNAPKSASAIQKLIDLGAVIVGKTGLSQFADAEDPTGDCVDFHAPWNPRGDGVRSTGGSSFGAGAVAGAYDWIDFTIGTDTGGSVRVPAATQSLYGLRPSRGTIGSDGLILIHPDLDMIGITSRSLDTLNTVSRNLLESSTPTLGQHDPPTLIYPAHIFPVADKPTQDIYDAVVSALEKVLKVKRQVMDFNKEWKKSPSYTGEGFEDHFVAVVHDYIVWGQYTGRSTFRSEYKPKFGRQPYVNPLAQFRYETGADMEPEHFKAIQAKQQQFETFIDSIFGPRSLMVTPFRFGELEPRDMYRSAPAERAPEEFGWGLRPAFQSPMAGQPEIVFPGIVDQFSLFSASHAVSKLAALALLEHSEQLT